MTLLESIAKSAVAAADGNLSPPHTSFPIISSSDQIYPNLEISPQSETLIGSQSLIKPASEWRAPAVDAGLNELLSDLCLKLKTKLKNPRNFTKGVFISLINSFFEKCSSKLQVQIGSLPKGPLDVNFTLCALEILGVLVSREVGALIAEGCVIFEIWNLLESVINKNLVGNLNSFDLVEKLAEKNQTELICLCVRKISNLRASEIYTALKFFLSAMSKDGYDGMVRVRKELEKEALLAVEQVKGKGLPKKASNLAREASILLVMAHDGFYSPEICLHSVFGSGNFDGVVLSSAVSRLDGYEVLALVRYFMKWLEKYERFPQARPCPSAGATLGLSACESVPTLEAVVKGLKLVLDEHFSYLVLGGRNRFDITAPCDIDEVCYKQIAWIGKYLNLPWVFDALDVPRNHVHNYSVINNEVALAFALTNDIQIATTPQLQYLLASGIDVLVYQGKLDLACNTLGNIRWAEGIPWKGQAEFVSKSFKRWISKSNGGKEAGEFKEVYIQTSEDRKKKTRFSFLTIDKAGHLVPQDQPEAALDMMVNWIEGNAFA